MQGVHCCYHRLKRRFKSFFMVLVIHIKVEETSKVFEGLAISNRKYYLRVAQKL